MRVSFDPITCGDAGRKSEIRSTKSETRKKIQKGKFRNECGIANFFFPYFSF
jgi:hypothetical protein